MDPLRTDASPPPLSRGGGGVYRLLVLFAEERSAIGKAKVLGSKAVQIGREGDASCLVLEDTQVSRTHTRIEPDGDGWLASDLGSRNGTFVNGRRIERTELQSGDVLRIGAHLILFQHLSAAATDGLLRPVGEGSALVGESVALRNVRQRLERLAPLSVPVLIVGESGVGKEIAASELHRLSKREGAFVPVNCAALPDQLVESELFGHAAGAFTGAKTRSAGLFGEAEHGTIFLDEIGEMAMSLQAKLLRALGTAEIRAVGDAKTRTLDVRVVAATNVNLERAVENEQFRGDLFARLLGGRVEIPPLRARPMDVLSLAHYFIGEEASGLSVDAAEALAIHDWPYNVRELEQIVRLAVGEVQPDGPLELDHLPEGFHQSFLARDSAPARSGPDLGVARDEVPTADALGTVLAHFEGNISHVAAYFGRSRRQIHRWADKLGLDVESFRS